MSFPEARKTLLKTITLVSFSETESISNYDLRMSRLKLTSTIIKAPALGFVPVAVHFHLFDYLAAIGKPATAQDVYEEHRRSEGDGTNLCTLLI
jgi:hypothetical protein